MKKVRSYTCQCGGVVSIPKGRRKLTIEDVKAAHDESCPQARRTTK